MTAAVTLAGEDLIEGEVIVNGTTGRAELEYPTDQLALPGETERRPVPGRTDLLENLLAHRADPTGVALLAPLSGTASFTALLETLTAPDQPLPALIDDAHLTSVGSGPGRVQVIPGVNEVLRRSAATAALPSEFGVAWAVPPQSREISPS